MPEKIPGVNDGGQPDVEATKLKPGFVLGAAVDELFARSYRSAPVERRIVAHKLVDLLEASIIGPGNLAKEPRALPEPPTENEKAIRDEMTPLIAAARDKAILAYDETWGRLAKAAKVAAGTDQDLRRRAAVVRDVDWALGIGPGLRCFRASSPNVATKGS